MDPLLLIKVLGFLALVLMMVYASFLIIKNKQPGRDHHQRIQVVAYRQVDQKLSVSLIEIDGQKFLIASAPQAISVMPIAPNNPRGVSNTKCP